MELHEAKFYMELHEAKLNCDKSADEHFSTAISHGLPGYTKNNLWDSFFAFMNYSNAKSWIHLLTASLYHAFCISRGCLHPILTFSYLTYTSIQQIFASKTEYNSLN